MLIYETYELLYELIQLLCGGDFQEIFALLTLYIININNKNHQKIANKIEPGKD
jgi:hypothetical protein